jgi:hypothetical protein
MSPSALNPRLGIAVDKTAANADCLAVRAPLDARDSRNDGPSRPIDGSALNSGYRQLGRFRCEVSRTSIRSLDSCCWRTRWCRCKIPHDCGSDTVGFSFESIVGRTDVEPGLDQRWAHPAGIDGAFSTSVRDSGSDLRWRCPRIGQLFAISVRILHAWSLLANHTAGEVLEPHQRFDWTNVTNFDSTPRSTEAQENLSASPVGKVQPKLRVVRQTALRPAANRCHRLEERSHPTAKFDVLANREQRASEALRPLPKRPNQQDA